MNEHDFDVLLLGISIGTLGTIGEIQRGVPAGTLEAAAREGLDVAERGLRAEVLADRVVMARFSDLVSAYVGRT